MFKFTRTLRAAATALALSVGPVAAEPFTLLIYETRADIALRDDQGPEAQAYWAAWGAFAQQLGQTGAMRGGAPLHTDAHSRIVRGDQSAPGQLETADGLVLGGYMTIEAESLDAAAAIAAQTPSTQRGGAVVVRASYPAPAMAPPTNQ